MQGIQPPAPEHAFLQWIRQTVNIRSESAFQLEYKEVAVESTIPKDSPQEENLREMYWAMMSYVPSIKRPRFPTLELSF